MVETWDEVGPSDYVLGVEEAEGTILKAGDKLDAVQSFGFPAGSVGFIDHEPANPEDIHFDLRYHCRPMENTNSVDSKDLCICIWVNTVLREGHHM